MSLQGRIAGLGDGVGSAVETFNSDPKAARLKEIRGAMTSFNFERGYRPANTKG